MALASKRSLSTGGKLAAIAALTIAATAYTSLARWSDTHAFMVNQTDSLPNWGFFVESGRFPARGDYVIFDPGHDPLTEKFFGKKPPAFAKIAYGVPGDVVERQGDTVLVNGTPVVRTKPVTRLGDPLTLGPTGVVPENCVFAGTSHKDGFDSRYAHIGFVCTDRLVGTATPLL